MNGVRLDKWLWAARFFKTRALAAKACELGRIESQGVTAKASREVRVGDLLSVRNDSGTFVVAVAGLSETRGPAAAAQALYQETEASREARAQEAEARKAMFAWEMPTTLSKPSKKERRLIHRFKGRG
jgi:ribosome-associated heat shock protein Hsp15